MKDKMKALKNRDRIFNIFFYIFMLAGPVMFFISSFKDDHEDRLVLLTDVYMQLTFLTLLALQFIRALCFESGSHKEELYAMNISSRTRISYDLITGFKALAVSSAAYFLTALFWIFGEFKGIYSGRIWPWFRMLSDSELNAAFFAGGCLSLMEDIILTTLMGAVVYVLFMIGKEVSVRIGWALLFMYSISVFIIPFVFYIHDDLLKQLFMESYGHPYIMEDMSPFMTGMLISDDSNPLGSLLVIFFETAVLMLLIHAAYHIGSRTDLAKGGAYRFKNVQIYVSAMTGVMTWFMVRGYFEDTAYPDGLIITLACILAAAVGAGMYYITRPKKG